MINKNKKYPIYVEMIAKSERQLRGAVCIIIIIKSMAQF